MDKNKFEELLASYIFNKSESDSYKKLTDKQNTEIKDIMTENDIDEYQFEDYIFKKTVSYRKSLDEDKLLELLLEKGYESVIKTRQYVDADLLESAIYHGEIDKDTLVAIDDCTEKTPITTLKFSKKKAK